jgi:hypothetical protein
MVNLVVWLHMLSGPCWCMPAALFGILKLFLRQLTCASVGEKEKFDDIKMHK